MSTVTVTSPATVLAPRGALWAANLAAAILRTFSGRSQRQTAAVAHAGDNDQRLQEAAEVRRIADGWRDVDARFAADLYAAADRHVR
jgi:hypothetical protein